MLTNNTADAFIIHVITNNVTYQFDCSENRNVNNLPHSGPSACWPMFVSKVMRMLQNPHYSLSSCVAVLIVDYR
jgi:hypothetical protein